jgi:hypothetical protein
MELPAVRLDAESGAYLWRRPIGLAPFTQPVHITLNELTCLNGGFFCIIFPQILFFVKVLAIVPARFFVWRLLHSGGGPGT